MNFKSRLILILSKSYVTISVLAVYVTLLSVLDFSKWGIDSGWKMTILLLIILFSFAYAYISTRNIKKINLRMPHEFDLTICFDDILNQEGIVAISVNTYFDTIVDNIIIAESTTHGQFIKKFFGGNEAELEQKLQEALKPYAEKKVEMPSRPKGRKEYYPIGTIAKIEKNDRIFYLVAMSHFNEDNRSVCTIKDYFTVIETVLEYADKNHKGKLVNLPLFGSGLSRLNRSKMDLLRYMYTKVKMGDYYFTGGLQFVLLPKFQNNVDLSIIKYLWMP